MAKESRDWLQDAMKWIREYEEYLLLSKRVVQELRAIYKCLGGMSSNGAALMMNIGAMPTKAVGRGTDAIVASGW